MYLYKKREIFGIEHKRVVPKEQDVGEHHERFHRSFYPATELPSPVARLCLWNDSCSHLFGMGARQRFACRSVSNCLVMGSLQCRTRRIIGLPRGWYILRQWLIRDSAGRRKIRDAFLNRIPSLRLRVFKNRWLNRCFFFSPVIFYGRETCYIGYF